MFGLLYNSNALSIYKNEITLHIYYFDLFIFYI